MAEKINDGGPAFPERADNMTLRDYFAAAALTGLLVTGDYDILIEAAEDAWNTADAMLRAREVGNG